MGFNWESPDVTYQTGQLIYALEAGTIAKGGDISVTIPYYKTFTDGKNGDAEIMLGPNDELSKEARNHKDFNSQFEIVRTQLKIKIEDVVARQITEKSLGNNERFKELLNSSSAWANDIGPVIFEDGNLGVIIHGTQQEEIGLSNFSIDYNPARPTGKTIEWKGNFTYTLYDDFAFSEADGKTGGFAGLVLSPAYKLQNYGAAKPYSIKLVVEEPIEGGLPILIA